MEKVKSCWKKFSLCEKQFVVKTSKVEKVKSCRKKFSLCEKQFVVKKLLRWKELRVAGKSSAEARNNL